MAVTALILFCLAITAALALGLSLVWALAAGWVLFSICALRKGAGPKDILRHSVDGAKTVFPVCSTLLCIGLLTAAWRASGTIACLVDLALGFVTPAIFAPCVFLCNCAISFLLGSCFATAATMGVISMSVAGALDVSPILAGGAIISGCYFGDRCSPMSTSALLTTTLAGTTVHRVIPLLMRSCVPAFAATLLIYLALSLTSPAHGGIPDTSACFAREYTLSWLLTIPALLVLALAAFRVPVRRTVIVSTTAAILLCLLVQHLSPDGLPRLLVLGFTAHDAEVGRLMNGGGLVSMVEVVCIVCLSSTYAGLFKAAGFLDGLHDAAARLARFGSIAPYIGVGLVTSALSCNQTLAIMLTHQIVDRGDHSAPRHAMDIEDSTLLLAGIIPWSIAATVPLFMTGAPMAALPLACYLWLLPLSRLVWAPHGV